MVEIKYKKLQKYYHTIVPIAIITPEKEEVLDALIDPGATTTAISSSVCRRLKLKKVAIIDTATATRIEKANVYRVKIKFVNKTFDTYIVGTKIPSRLPFSVLLGRNILDKFVITLDGIKKKIIIK